MAQPLFIGQILEVEIEKLTYHGARGLARTAHGIIFVARAAAGDRLQVEVVTIHKNYAEAEIVQVLTPDSSRREAPCTVYGLCGGCNLQHIVYEEQARQKSLMLDDLLRPLRNHDFEVRPFLKAPSEFFYRNRAQLQIHDGKLGFFARKSNQIIEFDRCWLLEGAIQKQVDQMKAQGKLQSGRNKKVELFSHDRAQVPVGFFSQVNTAQNLVLRDLVEREFNSSAPPSEVWDLYGGSGNFSLGLALQHAQTKFVCVESSQQAVAFGQAEAKRQNLQNIKFYAESVETFLSRAKMAPAKGHRLILLDPPRAGLSVKARQLLIRSLSRSHLLYISCNPSTFARDTIEIVKSKAARLQWVQGLDMFPQTDHIEVISCFAAMDVDSVEYAEREKASKQA